MSGAASTSSAPSDGGFSTTAIRAASTRILELLAAGATLGGGRRPSRGTMVTRQGGVKRTDGRASFNHTPGLTGMDEITEDRVLGTQVILRQPARGYRAGLDAALLAAACNAAPGSRVLE